MVRLTIDAPAPRTPRRSPGPGAKPIALIALLVVAFAGGFFTGRRSARAEWGGLLQRAADAALKPDAPGGAAATPPEIAAAPSAAPGDAASAAARAAARAGDATPAMGGAAPAAAALAGAAPTPNPAVPATTRRRLVATLGGALEDSLASALPAAERQVAGPLGQVMNRLLVWYFDMSRDGRRGDRIELVWEPVGGGGEGREPVVYALRYTSAKLGKTFAVYRHQPSGASFARYYETDGSEIEPRLVDGPIGEYEQITSLLRDGRRHKGVDFKAPVGSPVFAPFDGVVVRRNWAFRVNGNCLEIADARTGRRAVFLHLDRVPEEMRPGRPVKKGERIASSGNSGRSFAPHLHYQLETGDGRVLDPFEVHATRKVSLDVGARPAFDAERQQLDLLLTGG